MKRDRSSSFDSSTTDGSEQRFSQKPNSLVKTVSPPPLLRQKETQGKSATAAVEAGEKHVEDHLEFYSQHLLIATRPKTHGHPRLSHSDWVELYNRNLGSGKGHHFVIHQHDHPVAGTHYDLRLQCNKTSSISFAIMYGLPGDPNSRRLNRNATETRVHCLWNHLIETASLTTGTMLLWDTGEYEVLPYYERQSGKTTDESANSSDEESEQKSMSQPQKLARAFSQRKMRLRFHGTKLPKGYTLSIRLTKANYRTEQPKKPLRRRRRTIRESPKRTAESSDSESPNNGIESHPHLRRDVSSLSQAASPPPSRKLALSQAELDETAMAIASGDEDETIRLNNAYPGATNDIGSVHQRKWYLALDRPGSGFIKRTRKQQTGETVTDWVRKDAVQNIEKGRHPGGFDRFWVQGRDVERSVVTGRLAKDILDDEGVEGYVPRGLWRAVTE